MTDLGIKCYFYEAVFIMILLKSTLHNLINRPRVELPKLLHTHQLMGVALALLTLKRQSLQYFSPIILLFFNPKAFKLHKQTLPLVALFLIGMIHQITTPSSVGLIRMLQMGVVIININIISKTLNKGSLKLFLVSIILFATFYLGYDLLNENFIPSSKKFFGYELLRRYPSFIGEPNFSGVCLSLSILIAILIKSYKLILPLALCLLPTSSRTALLALLIFSFCFLIQKTYPAVLRKARFIFIGFLFLSPFSFPYISDQLDWEQRLFLNRLSSERFHLQTAYAKMALDKPFGTGYMQARKNLSPDTRKYGFYKDRDQHSLYLQIITELGFIGGLLFAYFVLGLFKSVSNEYLPYLYSFLSVFFFINGFNEIIFSVFLAIFLKYGKSSEPHIMK